MRTLPTDTMLATAMTIWKSKISRHYRDRGYQLFRGVFPRQEVETIAQAARLVSHFEDRLRRQNGQFEVNEFFPNTRLVRNTLLHPHLGLPEPLTPLSSALERLGQRLGLEEAATFATLLQQSAELGTSLSHALRVYSEEMRNKRLGRAEEKAYALPSKLVVPLTVFVFPVLIVVLLYPAGVRVMSGMAT